MRPALNVVLPSELFAVSGGRLLCDLLAYLVHIECLDLSHQIEVLDLVRMLNHDRGATVVMVLHDLNLAARYSDQIVAMRDGRIIASGRPEDVVTVDLLREVFSLDAQVIEDPVTGKPLVVPIGAISTRGLPQSGR